MEVALVGPLGRTVLGATKVTIGRAPDNTLVLADAKVSAYHAELRPEGPYYSLVDLSNGYDTFVNEQLVYSQMPRMLQPGDVIRVGDTKFTFTMDSGAQQPSSGRHPGVPTIPERLPPDPPNYIASTGYGMGNYAGPPPPSPGQQPPMYPDAQMSTYISPYETPVQSPGNTPNYGVAPTPVPSTNYPPNYGGAPTSVPPTNYTPNYTGPQIPVSQPRRRPSLAMIVSAVIAVLLIIAGIAGFFVYHTNQVAQDNTHATATAIQAQAYHQATATVVAQQNATATAVTGVSLTATTVATSNYAPFTKVALDEALTTASSDWSGSTICQISAAGYQVSVTQAGTIQYCLNTSKQYGEMAYQVMMTIHTGDCGGLAFRYNDVNNLYFFEVCQNGTYDMGDYINSKVTLLYPSYKASSAIHQGLDVHNLLAVSLQGNTVNMYVNGSHIDTATSSSMTTNAFSQGSIGVFADDGTNPTSVIYTNALVWTM